MTIFAPGQPLRASGAARRADRRSARRCVANSDAIAEAAPFFWASEEYPWKPCRSGCAIVIPAIPDRVVYHWVHANRVILKNEKGVAVSNPSQTGGVARPIDRPPGPRR